MANVINGTSTGSGGLISSGDDSGILNIQTNETTAMSIDASQSVDFTNNIDAPNTFGMKNRLINGGMTIAQRGTTSVSANGAYPIDRWLITGSQSSKFTAQQSSDAPTGFANSVVLTSSSAYPVTGNDYFSFYQQIEANNVSDLALGTASAKTVTVSFWVKSSLTGSFGGSLQNSAEDRCYSYAYTINAANTWEYKTITVVGDTTGTWLTGTSCGLIVWFGLGATGARVGTAGAWGTQSGAGLQPTGTVSLVGTSGATLYITGVQLEKGTQATSFDFRDYGREMMLCQRYFYKTNIDNATACTGGLYGSCYSAGAGTMSINHPVNMRSAPTASFGGTQNNLYIAGISTNKAYTIGGSNIGSQAAWFEFSGAGFTTGYGVAFNGQFSASAEL